MNPSTEPGFGDVRAWTLRLGGPGGGFTERASAVRERLVAGRGPFGRLAVGILSLLVAVPIFFLLLAIAFLVFVLVLVVAAIGVAFAIVRRAFGAFPRPAGPAPAEDGRENVRVVRRIE
jgi:hypothetical protein